MLCGKYCMIRIRNRYGRQQSSRGLHGRSGAGDLRVLSCGYRSIISYRRLPLGRGAVVLVALRGPSFAPVARAWLFQAVFAPVVSAVG